MDQINVAVAIIHDAGNILISQRRKNGTFSDLWEFPGGKVESGETAEQCLVREMREELDVAIRIVAPLPPVEHAYPAFAVRLLPFVCTITSGTPRPLASQRLAWVGVADLRNHAFPGANQPLLNLILQRPWPPMPLANDPNGRY